MTCIHYIILLIILFGIIIIEYLFNILNIFINRYDCIDDGTLEPTVKPTKSKKSK